MPPIRKNLAKPVTVNLFVSSRKPSGLFGAKKAAREGAREPEEEALVQVEEDHLGRPVDEEREASNYLGNRQQFKDLDPGT